MKLLELIQSGLKEIIEDLDSPMIFGHVCKGQLGGPGVVRVSSVIDHDSNYRAGFATKHDQAFLRHVQSFGRENTLLNWLVCLALSQKRNAKEKIVVYFQQDLEARQWISIDDGSEKTIKLSGDFVDQLASAGLAKKYVKWLYEGDSLSLIHI